MARIPSMMILVKAFPYLMCTLCYQKLDGAALSALQDICTVSCLRASSLNCHLKICNACTQFCGFRWAAVFFSATLRETFRKNSHATLTEDSFARFG